jgi:hypothetical protein
VSWDKYMKLAQGEKVLDNPQLLRKAVKKEGKDKAKRLAAWQARTQAVAEKQQAQQQQYAMAVLTCACLTCATVSDCRLCAR